MRKCEPRWITISAQPDAEVMAIAAEFGDAGAWTALDVGAGLGHNALALANTGHPVDVLESSPVLSRGLRDASACTKAPLRVIEAQLLSERLVLQPQHYRLIVVSDAISDLETPGRLRTAFCKLSGALAPAGLLLFRVLLRDDDRAYGARTMFGRSFARTELSFIERDLPLQLVSRDLAPEHPDQHRDLADSWPPTVWLGLSKHDPFGTTLGSQRSRRHWLLYQRCP